MAEDGHEEGDTGPSGPTAIDVHVHPATREFLVEAVGPFQDAVERHVHTSVPVRSVNEMAAELRSDGVLAVLLAWRKAVLAPDPPDDVVDKVIRGNAARPLGLVAGG